MHTILVVFGMDYLIIYYRVGTSILFWGKKSSHFPYQCFVGPDWPVVMLTYALIIGVNVIVLSVVSAAGWIPVAIGVVTCLILLYYYTYTIATNPGIIYKHRECSDIENPRVDVPPGTEMRVDAVCKETPLSPPTNQDVRTTSTEEEEENCPSTKNLLTKSDDSVAAVPTRASNSTVYPLQTAAQASVSNILPSTTNISGTSAPVVPSTIECGRCQLQRPYSARHCSYCDVCVDDLDHHCPYCGKCIGENNINAFHCFVGWLNFQSCYLFAVLLFYLFITAAKH